jgi:acetylornithine aminotransferase
MPESLIQKEQEYFFRTYKRLSLDIVRGEGCFLFDRGGKRFVDFFGGLAVNALGYRHQGINDAIKRQIELYSHISNFFVQETQVLLAEKLLAITGLKKVFFTNSGTEAIEGALKLGRKWAGGKGKTEVFGLSNSFHGRTMGALSLTERMKYREGYEPFLPNIHHLRFNDVQDLRAKVGSQTIGIVLEFIQGEGGINVVTEEYAKELDHMRAKYDLLLIADEIQSGIGRTGKFLGCEHFGIHPDIVVVAKALGGGLPLGAFLGTEKVADVFTYGVHGTTFGGNPVACAAGMVVLNEVVDNGLMRMAGERGDYLKKLFGILRDEFPERIRDVRGFGCMIGVELSGEGQTLVDELQNRGFLVNCTNTSVIRLLPPYSIPFEECDHLVQEIRMIWKQQTAR